jgi:hypothetical protein
MHPGLEDFLRTVMNRKLEIVQQYFQVLSQNFEVGLVLNFLFLLTTHDLHDFALQVFGQDVPPLRRCVLGLQITEELQVGGLVGFFFLNHRN